MVYFIVLHATYNLYCIFNIIIRFKQKLIELENLIKDKTESEEASKKYLDSSSELINTLVGDLVTIKFRLIIKILPYL